METQELAVMAKMYEEISKLSADSDATNRAIGWLLEKIKYTHQQNPTRTTPSPQTKTHHTDTSSSPQSFEDLAEWDDGDKQLTLFIRDFKGKNQQDAAFRFIHVVLFLHEQFSGLKSASSKEFLKPLLEQWRLYNGNVRTLMASMPGLHRKGDLLSLDLPAKKEALRFIAEIRDEKISGTWTPRNSTKPKKKPSQAIENEPQ